MVSQVALSVHFVFICFSCEVYTLALISHFCCGDQEILNQAEMEYILLCWLHARPYYNRKNPLSLLWDGKFDFSGA